MKGIFPRVTHPSATISFDLHVLSLPPAFVLSQNQTLKLSFDLTNCPLECEDSAYKALLFDEKPVLSRLAGTRPENKFSLNANCHVVGEI